MISSLPKPLQNDFDTIVIDILSRYSLDNKSVRRFVESVAQQARDINRQPRFLNEAKRSRGQRPQDGTEDTLSGGKEKPNFLTKLQGYQSAWNRGSLVGVFLEYLKNKREDQQAKLVQPKQDSVTGPTKEKADSQPAAQTIKSEREIVERFTDKITETRTNALEQVVNNLQKIQEIFSSPGLLGATKNILSVYKESGSAKPITPITSSTSYTAPTYSTSATNYSTINTTNTAATNNKSIELTQGEAQAQRQDLLKEEQVIILGGVNDKGARDLKKIIASIFEEQNKMFLSARSTAQEIPGEGVSPGAGGDWGALDLLADIAMAKTLLPGRRAKSLGGGSRGAKARARARAQGRGYQAPKGPKPSPTKPAQGPTTSKPKTTPRSARPPKAPRVGGIGGLLGGMLTFGGALAAGETLYGLGTEGREATIEKTQQQYSDEYFDLGNIWEGISTMGLSTGMALIGGFEDLFEQWDENWVQEQNFKGQKKLFGLQSEKKKAMIAAGYKDMESFDASLYGYKDVEQFKKDRVAGKLDTSKMQDWRQYLPNSSKPIKPSTKPLPTLNPDVKSLPPGATPADIEKKPPLKITYPDTQKPPESLRLINPSPVLGKGKMESLTPLTPQLAKPISPVPPSITETHVTNNNADKKVLADIAGNTEKTNHSLATLGDAVFKLAKVFDSKTMGGGNSVLINNNGQVQEYTSTSRIAANNVDPIRSVRDQFLATTV